MVDLLFGAIYSVTIKPVDIKNVCNLAPSLLHIA